MEIPEKGDWPALQAKGRPTETLIQPTPEPNRVPPTTEQVDTVSLTDRGRRLKAAIDIAHLLPEIREARIMKIKRQLETGEYRVKGDRIATNMIGETLENNEVLKHIDTQAITQPIGQPHAYDDQETAYHTGQRGGLLPGHEKDPI